MSHAFRWLVATCLAFSVAGCWIPEKFTATVSINKDGSYSYTYDGILTFGLALAAAAEGKLSAKDEMALKEEEEKIRKEPGFKKVEYLGKGRYQVLVNLNKKAGEATYFVSTESRFFSILPKPDGTIEVSGFNLSPKDVSELTAMGAKVDGKLKVSLAKGWVVVKHNAESTPSLMGLFGDYSWHIKSPAAVPFMLARNSSQPSVGATSAPSASAPTKVAMPTVGNTTERYYLATMKSNLRNMATYEEQYAADNRGAYFSGTATTAAPLQGFSPSQNVTVIARAFAGPPPSWGARSTHTQTAKTCDMTNGAITCTGEPSTQRTRRAIPAAVPQRRNHAPSELDAALSGTYFPVNHLPPGFEDFDYLTLFIKGPKIDGSVGQRRGVGVADRRLPMRNARLNGKQLSFESIQQDGVGFAFAGEFVGPSYSTRLRGRLKRLSSGGVHEADVELYLLTLPH